MTTKRVIAMTCMIALCFSVLAGCRQDPFDDYFDDCDTYYVDNEYDDTYYDDADEYDPDISFNANKEYAPVSSEILNLTFQFNEEQINKLEQTVSSIDVRYEKSEHFGVKESMDAYYALTYASIPPSTSVIKNNAVDYNTLLSIVKSNNKKPRSNSYYSDLPQKTLEDAVKIITNTLNYNLQTNQYINQNVLDYKLQNLSVLSYDDLGYAFYNYDETVLALNENILNSIVKDQETAFVDIVTHEANHIIQDTVIVRDDSITMNYGMCYQFEDLTINSLYWTWFIDGVAEHNTLLQTGLTIDQAYIYQSFVNALDALIASYALNNDNVYELNYITAQNDLEKFFAIFGCTTEAEKQEVLEMMVAYTLYLDTNDLIISNPFYEKTNIDNYTHEKQLLCSIGQSLAKLFYKNLFAKLKNNTVSLENVFALITMFETKMGCTVWYDSLEQEMYMDTFYNNYTKIQDAFFKEIADVLDMSETELVGYYTNYFHTANPADFQNSILTQAQNTFYQRIYVQNVTENCLTVNEAKTTFQK